MPDSLMTWEMITVIVLLVLTLVSFLRERWSTDMTAYIAFSGLMGVSIFTNSESLPSVNQLLNVFSNPAPVSIAAMFILSACLERSGAIEGLANFLERFKNAGYRQVLLIVMFAVALTSAFISNTPVVVVLLPVMISLARQMGESASRFLIPLSYASIAGGVCTVIGTSTNLLVSEIMAEKEMAPIGMFELSAVGLPLIFVMVVYLIIFGKKLLPVRETLTSILSEDERKEYITEAFVKVGSDAVGKTVQESGLMGQRGVRLLEVVRHGVAVKGDMKKIVLAAHDRLVLSCRPQGIAEARNVEGLDFKLGDDLEQITADEGAIVEGVIGPLSTITGRSVTEINFRQRFRMVVIAIHRHGRNVREKLDSLPLAFGDTLLMMGTQEAIENLRRSNDVMLLDRSPIPAKSLSKKKPIIYGTMVFVIAGVTFNLAPIAGMALLGVAILLATGSLTPKDAYDSIEWRILFLIYGMLGMGMAMETTGLTMLIADQLAAVVSSVDPQYQPYLMLLLIYLATNILTELLSNQATAVIMAPLAIGLAGALGLDARPFVVAVCVAASASFATPIGYQTNTYVYGVGGYRFGDFVRVGLPLNIMYMVVSVLLIPHVWPF